jgi:hypothetical protein
MLLGPSTLLLLDHVTSILSGARGVDKEAVLRTVGQGASFRRVEGVKLLTVFQENEDNQRNGIHFATHWRDPFAIY